jgi:hypothetical protein
MRCDDPKSAGVEADAVCRRRSLKKALRRLDFSVSDGIFVFLRRSASSSIGAGGQSKNDDGWRLNAIRGFRGEPNFPNEINSRNF